MWQIMKTIDVYRKINESCHYKKRDRLANQISWSPFQYKSMCTGLSIFYAMIRVENYADEWDVSCANDHA